ncbi:MAG TPA: ATP-binding protein [Pyrinomonadaceae bacterium]|nr:ATP-binding protein [Pyrinomonadaceae bacterium]
MILAAAIGWLIKAAFVRKPSSAAGAANRVDKQTAQQFALNKLFDATMNGMREGLLVVNEDLQVVASNRAAHQLFPFAAARLNSERLTSLTRNTQIYNAFLDAIKTRTEQSGLRVEIAAGRMFDLRVVPLTDVDGLGTHGALGVFFDITRLERLERVRQEFLSNVSHELRTPLTAILAFVETLETGGLDDKENNLRFLEIIRKNASRMHGLIDDILELSAIEAGTVQVTPEEIELRPIVNDVINSVIAKAEARQVAIVNQVDPAVVVYADPRRLEQMLTNLIDNAIKFNREDGRVIIEHSSGERDRIMVADTGDGIPSQHLPRLFERFYRVDRARSRDLGGTGLGLAIVKHLAKAHGGEVTVESKLGEGSLFTIDLPRGDGEASAVSRSENISEPIAGAAHHSLN